MQNKSTLLRILGLRLYLIQRIDAKIILTLEHALASILEHIIAIHITSVLLSTIRKLTLSHFHLLLTPIEPVVESFELGVVIFGLVIWYHRFLFVEREEGVGRITGFGF